MEYDYDGKSSTSTIVRSGCSAKTGITLYPNPSSGNTGLSIMVLQNTSLSIQILDSKGMVVQQRSVHLAAGTSNIPLDMNNYANGIYTVIASCNGETKTLKLVKK
jgi:hypothetical protein